MAQNCATHECDVTALYQTLYCLCIWKMLHHSYDAVEIQMRPCVCSWWTFISQSIGCLCIIWDVCNRAQPWFFRASLFPFTLWLNYYVQYASLSYMHLHIHVVQKLVKSNIMQMESALCTTLKNWFHVSCIIYTHISVSCLFIFLFISSIHLISRIMFSQLVIITK